MPTAIFIGDESLLIQCASQWTDAGHAITAIVTASDSVRDWAAGTGLTVEAPGSDLADRLPQSDWLFSIANLRLLPDTVLARATGAINFHDGPLPRYAGLNAPVWALLNGEGQHGITWHHITTGVDAGNIVAQEMFDISSTDTALTLNTKAYEAALTSFPRVIAAIASGDTTGTPQDFDQRTVYSRDARPDAGGLLDPRLDAAVLERTVRALDHGAYRNPLTTAKLDIAGQVVTITKASVTTSDAVPGTILSTDPLRIACGKDALEIGEAVHQDGRAARFDHLTVGQVIDLPTPDMRDTLTRAYAQAAAQDARWANALTHADPVTLTADTGTSGGEIRQHPLTLPGDPATLALTLADTGTTLAHAAQGLDGHISHWTPEPNDGVAFAQDIALRHPGLALTTPAIGLGTGTHIPGTALTIHADQVTYDSARLSDRDAERLAQRLSNGGTMSDTERAEVLTLWNDTAAPVTPACIHDLIAEQVARTPDATALVSGATALSYADLDARANRAAHVLRQMGVGPDTLVGLHTRRNPHLVVAALAIFKAGGAYVPLDPDYPADRVALYIEDSGAPVIVTTSDLAPDLPPHNAQVLELDTDPRLASQPDTAPDSGVTPDNLAYLIYTSGSTGRPKGVMVEHRNVANFFAGMDDRLHHDDGGTWLAVTSLSFDISVLELFYTLARGFKVVLSGDDNRAMISSGRLGTTGRGMDFSIFYWGNDDGVGPKKYELLLEGARFADQNGFKAIWTPERHFHAFGGPYPNPSVTGAAVAAVTENLAIRAGSCVAPLHHPARIAEEWAVIDNLTNGRVGLAIASGWQPDDFVLRPENTPPANKPAMLDSIHTLRKLWAGEAVEFPKADGTPHAVVTQPRPVSKTLPIWVTTAGNPQTWKDAGEIGANVLTHLLGQSVDEVADKIKIYHQALRDNGHDPADHSVTLMLHTFLADTREEAREIAREPMKDYLRSAAALIKAYAWAFPAFKRPENAKNPMDIDLGGVSEEDMEGILDFAFTRYFEDSGLFGTIDDATARVEQLKRIGVTEVACLIDYGIPVPQVLDGLKPLADVVQMANVGNRIPEDDFSIAAQLLRHEVTHLQCTPSMARMIAADDEARFALKGVKHLMIGGEALPGALVDDLNAATDATIENMYGPTETTIWSSTETAQAGEAVVNIGTPLKNQRMYVLDDDQQPVPVGTPGELYIAGDGVARGYFQRDDLTADRFLPDPFHGGRMYRTGDLVRWRGDGHIEFIGRADFQLKLRGYRIELGEIESRMEAVPGVTQATVVAREDTPGDIRLVGYHTGTATDDALKSGLSALPDYMMPSTFVRLDAFPLTPNKKVDRKALPSPDQTTETVRPRLASAPPTTGIERQIAQVWEDVLGVQGIGPKDNFFELGGHSLLAVQAHREIKARLNLPSLSITDIFRFPTLGGLAGRIGQDAAPAPEQGAHPPANARAAARGDMMARRRAMRARRRA
ncbi:MupA/Atu3671 family FMN-dependent luciferase-like monooxygenase [Pseudaestuariivita atlantica]|uniref:Peptide synthetase n=1 Tax=Pseudaestuariivita atlantica TaxID=1317121 RepID=A0A0L1JP48_9RHOB|nr:MupA/Atu3671 family FMN-dependent luciferase-like monooxygenase [Pseudaestuariivita atlantica]KNG93534.1 peptide synthetase [Pseudaestuariivita atlantica]